MANTSLLAAFERMWQHVTYALSGKSDISHNHNDTYYTESEIDTKISSVTTSITNITNGTTKVGKASTADSATTATSATTASTATKATQDGNGNVISSTYETKADATSKLTEAKTYTDSAVSDKADANHNHDNDYDTKGSAETVQDALDAHTDNADIHFTATERTKLSGIEAGAQKNAVTGIKGNSESSYRTGNVNITKANIGLGNVDNTSDTNKPVSTAQQTAIDSALDTAKAYSDTNLATAKSYTDTKFDAIMGEGASETLNTIGEISEAIQTHQDVTDALNSAIGTKANASDLTSHTSNKSNPHGVTLSQLGITATASELNILDGITATTAELNYMDGVTSNVQTQLDGKAASSHGTHVSYSTTAPKMDGTASAGSASAVARTDHVHPTDTSRASQTDLDALAEVVNGKAPSSHSHEITAGATDDDVVVLTGTKGTNGVSYSASHANSGVSAGTYKSVTVNAKGHVTAGTNPTTLSGYGITNAYTKAEVDGLLDDKSDTTHTHTVATTSANGFMSADDKEKLDSISPNANYYVLPTASSSLGGVKTTSTVTSTSGLTACPIISGIPYYKDTNTTYTLSSFGITATAAELNALDGITATVTELNYCDGVTSNIQTQIDALDDAKSDTGHTHNYAGSSSAGGAATSANKLNTNAGSATQPIYFSNGVPVATTYALNKTVPSNAVFTDTNNKVTQTITTTNANYRVLLSSTADDTTRTEGARKDANFYYNPSTNALTVGSIVMGSATMTYDSTVGGIVITFA